MSHATSIHHYPWVNFQKIAFVWDRASGTCERLSLGSHGKRYCVLNSGWWHTNKFATQLDNSVNCILKLRVTFGIMSYLRTVNPFNLI